MNTEEDPQAFVSAVSSSEFATTHWSMVVAAGETQSPESAAALETLCRAYWFPLYAYVRRQGASPQEAQDLTQGFFARFLDKQYVAHASPESGRFRTFLLTSLKHFLVSEWRRAKRQKRGGGQVLVSWDANAAEESYAAEPPGELTSEKLYERRWAVTLMERVLTQLSDEYEATGKDGRFERLKDCVWGSESHQSYTEIGAELGLTEGAVKTSVHRLRQRCRELLRAEIAQTVAQPEEIDDELRHLIEIFSG